MSTAISSTQATSPATAGTAGAQATSAADASERFLKLLVAQMKNQDPLSPMDNAQVTSQMAQISTVTGIEQLNGTVQTLSGQFGQLRALQGAQLVGHQVLLAGNRLDPDSSGKATAGVELAGPADSVVVEVLGPSGKVVDTLDLGAQSAGRHGFSWTPTEAQAAAAGTAGFSFRVTAKSGAASVTATALNTDTVQAVATEGNALMLELASGRRVDASTVKALS